MDCEVCLSEKVQPSGNILRTVGLEVEEIRKILGGMEFTVKKGPGILDLGFNSREDLIRAKEKLGSSVYSEGEPLEEVVGRMLRERGLTLSVAESCTGGLIGARLVNIPGSSEYFMGGVIVYSNDLKVKLLGVKEETLRRYGAVSAQTCGEMLEGLKNRFGTSAGIAVTGIAGPGGTPTKREGLTYVGVYLKEGAKVEEHIFEGSRNEKRFIASQKALETLRAMILKEER